MAAPKVINLYRNPESKKLENYLYIGRPSSYGNPYSMSNYSREASVSLFRARIEYGILTGRIRRDYFRAFSDKVLGCYCKPHQCHGDVFLEYWHHASTSEGWYNMLKELEYRRKDVLNNYVIPVGTLR